MCLYVHEVCGWPRVFQDMWENLIVPLYGSLAALVETMYKFVNMFQASNSNYCDKSWHNSMHLRASGGRHNDPRPDASACGRWAAGGTTTHISMHLRAGGGRAS